MHRKQDVFGKFKMFRVEDINVRNASAGSEVLLLRYQYIVVDVDMYIVN